MTSPNPYVRNRLLHQLHVESQIRQQQLAQRQQSQHQPPQSMKLQTAVINAQRQLNQLQYQHEQFVNHTTPFHLPKLQTNQIYPNVYPSHQIQLPLNINNINMMSNMNISNHNQYTHTHTQSISPPNNQYTHLQSMSPTNNQYTHPLKQSINNNVTNNNINITNDNDNKHQHVPIINNNQSNDTNSNSNSNDIDNDNNNDNMFQTKSDHDLHVLPYAEYFDLSINNGNTLFDTFNETKRIKPITRDALNCFGNFEIDSLSNCIYEWIFLICGDNNIIRGTSVVIGIYGYTTPGEHPVFPHCSFYKACDTSIGYGYNIGQHIVSINRTHNLNISNKYIHRHICPNDTITMRLDLINYTLSYKHNNNDLGIAVDQLNIFDAYHIQNKLNGFYRMAVKFGKNCQNRSIELLSFKIIDAQYDNDPETIKSQNIKYKYKCTICGNNNKLFYCVGHVELNSHLIAHIKNGTLQDNKQKQLYKQIIKQKIPINIFQLPIKPPLPNNINNNHQLLNSIETDNNESICQSHPTKPPLKRKNVNVDIFEENVMVENEFKNNENERQIIVKELNGNVMRFHAKQRDSIISIKIKIAMKTGISPKKQRLIFGAKELNNDCVNSQFGIGNELVLYLVISNVIHSNDNKDEKCQLIIENKERDVIKQFTDIAYAFFHQEMDVIQEKLQDTKMKLETTEYGFKKLIEQLENKNKNIELKSKMYIKQLEEQNERLFKSNLEMKQFISDKNKENECVACMDLQRSHICLPCGHICLCENCTTKINDLCPICQGKCSDIIKVFK